MINCEPMTAKNRAIRIMDVNIIKNSIIEESITSTLEKPRILNMGWAGPLVPKVDRVPTGIARAV